jgi:hypothetical protein
MEVQPSSHRNSHHHSSPPCFPCEIAPLLKVLCRTTGTSSCIPVVFPTLFLGSKVELGRLNHPRLRLTQDVSFQDKKTTGPKQRGITLSRLSAYI